MSRPNMIKPWLVIAFGLAQAQALAQTPPQAPPVGPMQSGQHSTPPAPGATAPAPTSAAGAPDAKQLFATVCGWCHSSGGREAGKGPKLMGSTMTDAELVNRIKVGKVGQMPGFASSLNEQQLADIVAYIRNLKPE